MHLYISTHCNPTLPWGDQENCQGVTRQISRSGWERISGQQMGGRGYLSSPPIFLGKNIICQRVGVSLWMTKYVKQYLTGSLVSSKKITVFVWGGWVRGRVLLSYCTDIRKDFVLIDNNWHVVWCSRPYELTMCSSKDPSICNQDPSTSAHITSISFIALDNNPGPFSWLRLEWNQGESL